jgi:hypothetical protein
MYVLTIFLYVDPLLGKYRKISNYTTAYATKWFSIDHRKNCTSTV